MLRLAEKYGDRPAAELPLLFHRIMQNAIRDWFRRQKVRSLWTTLLSSLTARRARTTSRIRWKPWRPPTSPTARRRPGSSWSRLKSLKSLSKRSRACPRVNARLSSCVTGRNWTWPKPRDVMGCSEGSVKTHCSRATHALAAALTSARHHALSPKSEQSHERTQFGNRIRHLLNSGSPGDPGRAPSGSRGARARARAPAPGAGARVRVGRQRPRPLRRLDRRERSARAAPARHPGGRRRRRLQLAAEPAHRRDRGNRLAAAHRRPADRRLPRSRLPELAEEARTRSSDAARCARRAGPLPGWPRRRRRRRPTKRQAGRKSQAGARESQARREGESARRARPGPSSPPSSRRCSRRSRPTGSASSPSGGASGSASPSAIRR